MNGVRGESMSECIFCKIVSGEIPSNMVYEDETVYAFYDNNPQAPVHILFIPKQHIASTSEINKENSSVVADIFEAIAVAANELNLDEDTGLYQTADDKHSSQFHTCISMY